MRLVRLGLVLLLAFFLISDLGCAALNLSLGAVRQGLKSHPNSARSYGEALRRFQKIQDTEGPELNPVCLSILLTHGKRTKRAVVFFHGLTNCPEQFRELGRTFYELGLRGRILVLLGFAGITSWWLTLSPTQDADWQPQVAILAYANREGIRFTVHNIRYFEYRCATDFTPRYDTRDFDLATLRAAESSETKMAKFILSRLST